MLGQGQKFRQAKRSGAFIECPCQTLHQTLDCIGHAMVLFHAFQIRLYIILHTDILFCGVISSAAVDIIGSQKSEKFLKV